MDTNFEIMKRKIIRVGNSYAVALTPTKAIKYGFDLGTKVQVGLRDGIVIITQQGKKEIDYSELTKSDEFTEKPIIIKANKQNLQGLNELSNEIGQKSLAWTNQRTYGYNANLRLGDKRRRVVIRRGQVLVLNLDLITLTSFPDSINAINFPALKGLRMSNCQLRDMDMSTIDPLPPLEVFVLSDNDIDEIDLSMLSGSSNLNQLRLNNNLLDFIDLSPLKTLKNLESINLSHNELETLDLQPLQDSYALNELYLNGNYLTEIDLSPLRNTNRMLLSLENNPINEIDLEPLFEVENLTLGLPESLSTETQKQLQYLEEKGVNLSIKPVKTLTTAEIFNLPPELQDTALTLLSLTEGSIQDIANDLGLPVKEVTNHITILQKMGYVGSIRKGGRTIFFRTL